MALLEAVAGNCPDQLVNLLGALDKNNQTLLHTAACSENGGAFLRIMP
jgi:hypothetical protein